MPLLDPSSQRLAVGKPTFISTRFGPLRTCIKPKAFRSAKVMKAIETNSGTKTTKVFTATENIRHQKESNLLQPVLQTGAQPLRDGAKKERESNPQPFKNGLQNHRFNHLAFFLLKFYSNKRQFFVRMMRGRRTLNPF